MFLISDIVVYKGQHLKCNIVDRFNKLYKLLEEDYVEDRYLDICPLRVKRLFNYSEYNDLILNFIPKLSYGIRGLYFNTLNPKHCNQLFIYKEQKRVKEKVINKSEQVKTYEIRSTIQPEIYDLYYLKDSNITKLDVARISGLKVSRLIKNLFNNNESVYVKCKFNNKFNKWEPFEEGNKEDLETE